MSFRIAFIGAGSLGFTRRLVADLLSVPEFNNVELSLHDINKENLSMVSQLIKRDVKANGLDKVKVSTSVYRRTALQGARYVFNVTRIGGLEAFASDIEIPLSYGVDQCVGDTLCAGGIMYGQRGIQAILDFCKDIRECCEQGARLFNYANPMAMLTWAANTYGGVECIGLCHGVQGGHHLIARALGVKKEEVDIICAGINHQTWYVDVRHKGKDVTGKLLAAMEADPHISKQEKVRIDMLRRFGYFSTESNGHLSEYVPWYRKRKNEIKRWIDLGCWINGETGGYLRVCTEGRNWFKTDFPNWLKEPPLTYSAETRSEEHGSYILEGLETNRIYRGHFNVINNGCITNLPDDAVVEVPGYVDHLGMNIPQVGDLPLGCAAVCQQSINVQRLAVEAAVHGNDAYLRQAMLLDPLTGAVLNPPEVWQMVDELLVAQEAWLPQYKKAIRAAKKRLRGGKRIKTSSNKGAARLKTKSIDEMKRNAQKARDNAGAADKAGFTKKKKAS